MNTKHKTFVLPIIIAVIMLISVAKLPYDFYTIMRIVVPLLSIIYVIFECLQNNGKFSLILVPNIIIAILWNPIEPIYLAKETWVIIDFVACFVQLAVALWSCTR